MQIVTLQELSEYIQPGRPIICFDFGTKKIGIALSTPDHSMCMPHGTVFEANAARQIDKCAEIAIMKNACAIIVGLPLNLDSTQNTQSELTQKFAGKLAAKSKLPVYLQDERMTSKAADNLLKIAGMDRKSRNKKDDSIAANLILDTTMNLLKHKHY